MVPALEVDLSVDGVPAGRLGRRGKVQALLVMPILPLEDREVLAAARDEVAAIFRESEVPDSSGVAHILRPRRVWLRAWELEEVDASIPVARGDHVAVRRPLAGQDLVNLGACCHDALNLLT